MDTIKSKRPKKTYQKGNNQKGTYQKGNNQKGNNQKREMNRSGTRKFILSLDDVAPKTE
jgi:hypothetical protein